MVMKKVTIITRPGANEEEQAKAAAMAFNEFIKTDLEEYQQAVQKIVDDAKSIGFKYSAYELAEDVEFEVIQHKQLPSSK